MGMLVNASSREQKTLPHTVKMLTAGAAPPSAILEQIETLGFDVTHAYGLTECYGPGVVSEWHPEWDELPTAEKASKKARQGVPYLVMQGLTVMEPKTMQRTPADSNTMGEVFMRGNNLMKGYLKNKTATEKAFLGGWFHTGDIGHMDSEGWIYIDDRKKDVVISGGENIYPAELENVLAECALLSESTVVGVTDSRWGEIPVVVAVAAEGFEQNSEAILQLFDGQIAGFKHPKRVIWTDQLPRNVMGKVLKHEVRDLITKSETAT